mmetsp:Transcript_4662/g.15547  ORF Transcript_4662/g.15547 Transcript_4662/m.15547 type:complete len:213 (+) Transcript_4662:841-1479(+)
MRNAHAVVWLLRSVTDFWNSRAPGGALALQTQFKFTGALGVTLGEHAFALSRTTRGFMGNAGGAAFSWKVPVSLTRSGFMEACLMATGSVTVFELRALSVASATALAHSIVTGAPAGNLFPPSPKPLGSSFCLLTTDPTKCRGVWPLYEYATSNCTWPPFFGTKTGPLGDTVNGPRRAHITPLPTTFTSTRPPISSGANETEAQTVSLSSPE